MKTKIPFHNQDHGKYPLTVYIIQAFGSSFNYDLCFLMVLCTCNILIYSNNI